jgi:hypothetical protein
MIRHSVVAALGPLRHKASSPVDEESFQRHGHL